jgi:hypothetical protein
MPRAYIETILSSKPGKRRWYLAISCGCDQLRVEGRQPVARDLQVQLAGAGQHRLGAVAVAAIRPTVGLALPEVVVDLGVQRPLGQGLLQAVEQAPVGQGGSGIGSGEELVQDLIRDRGRLASRHTMAPSAAPYGPKHGISDSLQLIVPSPKVATISLPPWT